MVNFFRTSSFLWKRKIIMALWRQGTIKTNLSCLEKAFLRRRVGGDGGGGGGSGSPRLKSHLGATTFFLKISNSPIGEGQKLFRLIQAFRSNEYRKLEGANNESARKSSRKIASGKYGNNNRIREERRAFNYKPAPGKYTPGANWRTDFVFYYKLCIRSGVCVCVCSFVIREVFISLAKLHHDFYTTTECYVGLKRLKGTYVWANGYLFEAVEMYYIIHACVIRRVFDFRIVWCFQVFVYNFNFSNAYSLLNVIVSWWKTCGAEFSMEKFCQRSTIIYLTLDGYKNLINGQKTRLIKLDNWD